MQRQHRVDLEFLIENCGVDVLRQLLVLRLGLLFAPGPDYAHWQLSGRIIGIIVTLVGYLIDLQLEVADVDVDDNLLVDRILRCTSCYILGILLESATLLVSRRSHFIHEINY